MQDKKAFERRVKRQRRIKAITKHLTIVDGNIYCSNDNVFGAIEKAIEDLRAIQSEILEEKYVERGMEV